MATGNPRESPEHQLMRAQMARNERVGRLATYNAEVGRGLVHTDDWMSYMHDEQVWFDAGCPAPEPIHRTAL